MNIGSVACNIIGHGEGIIDRETSLGLAIRFGIFLTWAKSWEIKGKKEFSKFWNNRKKEKL
jgi:hypothetical protein